MTRIYNISRPKKMRYATSSGRVSHILADIKICCLGATLAQSSHIEFCNNYMIFVTRLLNFTLHLNFMT